MAACAGDDSNGKLGIGVEPVDGIGDRLRRRAVDRVARVGTADGDDEDRAVDLDEDGRRMGLVNRHRITLSSAA